MDLKEVLGEELFEQVKQKTDAADVKLIINDGNFIPRDRFNEKTEEIKGLQAELNSRDEQIEALKADSNASKELQDKIQALQEENSKTRTELEGKLKTERVNSAVEKELLKARARNPKTAQPLLDLESLEVDEEGNVKGLEEQLKTLKEQEPYLFEDTATPARSGGRHDGTGAKGYSREDIANMGHDEINELFEKGLLQDYLQKE